MSPETFASFRQGRVQFRRIIILDALKVIGQNVGSSILSKGEPEGQERVVSVWCRHLFDIVPLA